MINSKKFQMIIIALIAAFCLPVLAAEPNLPAEANQPAEPNDPNSPIAELKFEVDESPMTWDVQANGIYYRNPGPVKPDYAAEFRLHEDYPRRDSMQEVMEVILKSPISKKFSKQQQEFLESELAVSVIIQGDKPFYTRWTCLYAVSEEDTKLMTQAYLDGLNISVQEFLSDRKMQLTEFQQAYEESQKTLSQKQKELEEAQRDYQDMKNSTYYRFSSDDEAVELAKENILEIEKSLNELNIELAGIQEQIETIERFRTEAQQDLQMRAEMYQKLNEMYIELMIELNGLKARRRTAEEIREEDGIFLSCYNLLLDLKIEERSLEEKNNGNKGAIESIINFLADISEDRDFQPPKVYNNTVTIHPVITED